MKSSIKDKIGISFIELKMSIENLTNLSFQTFFILKEQSNCPLLPGVVRVGKKLKDMDLIGEGTGIISLGYGKRVLVNGKNVNLGNIKREDVLEIVDYDPIKKIVLAIGQKEPCIETPVHWLIHHARDDVNAIIQLNGKRLIKRLPRKTLMTEKEYPPGSLELAKEVLKTLRNSRNIVIQNKGVLFVGTSLKEVEDLVLKAYEESE